LFEEVFEKNTKYLSVRGRPPLGKWWASKIKSCFQFFFFLQKTSKCKFVGKKKCKGKFLLEFMMRQMKKVEEKIQ